MSCVACMQSSMQLQYDKLKWWTFHTHAYTYTMLNTCHTGEYVCTFLNPRWARFCVKLMVGMQSKEMEPESQTTTKKWPGILHLHLTFSLLHSSWVLRSLTIYSPPPFPFTRLVLSLSPFLFLATPRIPTHHLPPPFLVLHVRHHSHPSFISLLPLFNSALENGLWSRINLLSVLGAVPLMLQEGVCVWEPNANASPESSPITVMLHSASVSLGVALSFSQSVRE